MSNHEASCSIQYVSPASDFPYFPGSFSLSSHPLQNSDPSWLSKSQPYFDLNDNIFSDWTKDLRMVGENNSPILFPPDSSLNSQKSQSINDISAAINSDERTIIDSPPSTTVLQARTIRRKPRKHISQTFACPCFQEDVFRGRKPYAMGYPHKICPVTCNMDIAEHVPHGSCTLVKRQRRRDTAEIQWRSLFSTLYPHTVPIPSPYNRVNRTTSRDASPLLQGHPTNTATILPQVPLLASPFQAHIPPHPLSDIKNPTSSLQFGVEKSMSSEALDRVLNGIFQRSRFFVQSVEAELHCMVPLDQRRTAKFLVGNNIIRQLDNICSNHTASTPESST